MARLTVYSASGVKKYEGVPSFVDSYLKVGYLEFREVTSAAPIQWEVGDYVDYPRTGLRYKLYTVPVQTVKKQARRDSYGAAFVYQNVQFFEPTQMLDLAPFRDLVRGDNKIHFTTQNNIAVWDDVYGIAERIEVSLNEMFPGQWSVNVVSTEDQELLDTLRTELNYSVDGVTCLGALDKIYELWNNIGWTYSYKNGKHTITIGGADVRTSANTAPDFTYGKGNGLVTLERSISNRDAMATRLYVYGSSKNMVSRYYNNLPASIKDKDSIDIQHLMLPIEPIAALEWPGWGKTDGQYDASKSFIQNDDAVAKYGLIVKSVYLDGTENEDIFPTLKNITIGEVRNLLGSETAKYYPKENIYKDNDERVDLIQSVVNPSDPGVLSTDGTKYYTRVEKSIDAFEDTFYGGFGRFTHSIIRVEDFDEDGGELTISPEISGHLFCSQRVLDGVKINFLIQNGYGNVSSFDVPVEYRKDSVGGFYYDFTLPEVTMPDTVSPKDILLSVEVVAPAAISGVDVSFHLGAGSIIAGLAGTRTKTFRLSLKQMGFDINERAALGNGKATITMKSGMCNGRSFQVKSCKYKAASDTWELLVWRQRDSSVDMWFPNADYKIESGDSFVLYDIAMPDVYIKAAAQKLLVAGRKLLAKMSTPTPVFTPKVDAKVIREYQIANSTELSPLRAGMYLHIADEDIQSFGNDYVLIDTVTINEGEANIPTYTITLREKKKVTIKESVAANGSDMSSSVAGNDNTSGQQAAAGGTNLDEVWESLQNNKDPYKDSEINEAHIPGLKNIKERIAFFDDLFEIIDGAIHVKKSRGLYSDSFISAGGKSTTTGGGSSFNLLLSWDASADNTYALGAILGKELHETSKILDGRITDLENKATSVSFAPSITEGIKIGAITIDGITTNIFAPETDLSNYYTKEQTYGKGDLYTKTEVGTLLSSYTKTADFKSLTIKVAGTIKGTYSPISGLTVDITAADLGLTAVMRYEGVTTSNISEGSTTNPIVIDGASVSAYKGMVVSKGVKEFFWTGSAWKEYGDEGSYALKTVKIEGTGYLTGGGTLEANRTIDLLQSVKDDIENGATAYSWGDQRSRISTLEGYFNAGAAKEAEKVSNKLTFTTVAGVVTKTYDGSSAVSVAIPGALADLTEDDSHKTVTAAEKTAWNELARIIKIENDNVHIYGGVAADTYVSAGGKSPTPGGGGGSYDRLDSWASYDSTKATWVLSAMLGADLNTRVGILEARPAVPDGVLTTANYANTLDNRYQLAATAINTGNISSQSVAYATHSKYVDITAGLTKASDIVESGLRLYAGAGYRWEDSTNPTMAYAAILAIGTPSRGFQIWAAREGDDIGLRWRKGIQAATSWGATHLIYDDSNIGSASVAYATSAGSAPASDVYAWAKAATKPSYNFSEIGSKPTTISGYGITDAITTGNIGSQSVAYATSAGSVSWGNVSGRPTALSSFTDDVVSGHYLPLSGGTLSNDAWAKQLTIYRSNSDGNAVIAYINEIDGLLGCLGVAGNGDPFGKGVLVFTDSAYNNYKVYHSGNSNKLDVAWSASSLSLNGVISGVTGITFRSTGAFNQNGYGIFQASVDNDAYTWAVRTFDGSDAISVSAHSGNVKIKTLSVESINTFDDSYGLLFYDASKTYVSRLTGTTYIRSGNTDLVHRRNGIDYTIYDSSNSNTSSVQWTASQINTPVVQAPSNNAISIIAPTGKSVQIVADGGREDEQRNICLTAAGEFRPYTAAAGVITLGSASVPWGAAYIKSTGADIVSLYRNNSFGGAFIDYYNNNQTTNFWRVGMTAGGKFAIISEIGGTNYEKHAFNVDASGNITAPDNVTCDIGTADISYRSVYSRYIKGPKGYTLRFQTTHVNGTVYEPLTISDSNGKIGIRTDSPDCDLTIYSTDFYSLNLKRNSTAKYGAGIKFSNSNNGFLAGFGYDYFNNWFAFTNINDVAVLKVSTTSSDVLQVEGSASLKNNIPNILSLYRTSSSGGAFIDYYAKNNTTNYWRIGHSDEGYAHFEFGGVCRAYLDRSGNFSATGQVTAGTASDARLKTNITSLATASVLRSLRPVEFDWNETAERKCSWLKGHDVGLIAQEVMPLVPSAISSIFEDYYRVDYNKITPYLIKGWQEHEDEITTLKRRVADLENQLRQYTS